MDNNFSLFQFLQYKFFKLDDRVSKLPDSSTQQALLQAWKSHLKNNPIHSSPPQQQQQEEHFSSLPFPSEILVHILSYLPFHQVLHQSSINKSWYVASCDDYLWTVFLMHWMQSYNDDSDNHSLLWNNNDFLDSLLLSSTTSTISTTTTTINDDDEQSSSSTVISIDEESMVNEVKTQQDAKWKMIEWFYRGRDELIKQRQSYLEEMSLYGTFNNNNNNNNTHHPIFNTYHANNQSISSLIFQHLIAQNNNQNNNSTTYRKKRRQNSNENSLLLFDPIRMCYVTKKHLWGDCGTIVLGVAASVIYLLSQSRIRSLMSQRTVLKSMLMGTLVNTIMRYALWDAYYDDKRRYKWKSGRWPHTGVAFLIGCLCTLRATEGWRESSLE